jgi:predicted ribosome quality control (RQC) complex YloA/Tae2 family protein
LDFQILSQVIQELSDFLSNARVERVFQGQEGGLYLLLQRDRKKYTLLLSPDRSLPRMHLVSEKPRSDGTLHPFILALKSLLAGVRLKSVSLLNADRIVEMCFARSSEEQRLVFELTGSSTNLFILDTDLRIVAAYHPVPLTEHATRTLLPGAHYALPRKRTSLTPDKPLPVADEVLSPNKRAEVFYAHLAGERHLSRLRSEVNTGIHKAAAKIERKRVALAADLASAERADEFKEAGDLILANLRNLKTGMDHAELMGYDGRMAFVKLDPKRSPSKNAELKFKAYKKAKAGQQIISSRLQDAVEEASYLRSRLDSAEKAEDASALNAVRSELAARGYLREKRLGTGTGKASPPKKVPGFRTVVLRGWEILVGSSAAGNDYITTKLARPDDLWLHAEGLPGSHVLVRNAKRGEIPADVLVKAAALAAHYSKGRNADKVPVTYTKARHVKKPKGAKPGLVTLSERKTVMVRPEDGLSL